jgi:hypothetical protein
MMYGSPNPSSAQTTRQNGSSPPTYHPAEAGVQGEEAAVEGAGAEVGEAGGRAEGAGGAEVGAAESNKTTVSVMPAAEVGGDKGANK